VNTCVELAKTHGLARLAPVVNGMLRAALRARDQGESPSCSGDAAVQLAFEHSLPDWLAELLLQWRDQEGATAVAAACNQVPPLDLRVNRLRATPAGVAEALAEAGHATAPIPGCPDGLTLLGSSGDLRRWPGYDDGHWCVQDRAAQWVAPLLEAQPGERILDACAAPGGKATHLAELIGDQGEIWAVDRSPGRLKRVVANAARLGVGSIHALAADAATLLKDRPQWGESFQRILIDAPCSGLGTLARHPDARWRVTPESIRTLLPQQQALLDGLVPLLAPSGMLVYSTCTIHPDENQAQVQLFLNRHTNLHLIKQSQRWPDQVGGGDGFYCAVFRRGCDSA
jgi:16S rRNA (cytosine967-C5)-methyltransferase